jgi:hypothetical protein|tara:strand:+ start:3658 stop:4317 length:660 start_codon:yes stop_codon:yes gene_type:complete
MTNRNYQTNPDNITQVHFTARVEVADKVQDRFTAKGKPFAQIQLRELYANGQEADIVKSWNAFDVAGSICKKLNEGAVVEIVGTEKIDQQKGITYYNIRECTIKSNPEPKPVEAVQDERALFGIYDDDLPQKPSRPPGDARQSSIERQVAFKEAIAMVHQMGIEQEVAWWDALNYATNIGETILNRTYGQENLAEKLDQWLDLIGQGESSGEDDEEGQA